MGLVVGDLMLSSPQQDKPGGWFGGFATLGHPHPCPPLSCRWPSQQRPVELLQRDEPARLRGHAGQLFPPPPVQQLLQPAPPRPLGKGQGHGARGIRMGSTFLPKHHLGDEFPCTIFPACAVPISTASPDGSQPLHPSQPLLVQLGGEKSRKSRCVGWC